MFKKIGALSGLARRKAYVFFIFIFCSNLFALSIGAKPLPQKTTTSSTNIVRFKVSKPEDPRAISYAMNGVSKSGHVLAINNRYLTLDGKPWLPVMGEFQYSRYPAEEWEEEVLKMKAAGIQIIASYTFWIHQEEVQGQFDWSGNRDLRRFVQLCAKHGLYFFARIGPYAHGEVRNGGLPDWVVKEGNIRRNSPEYLAHVRDYYSQIGRQLQGLFWKDGGPVVGVQLENEYFLRGPGAGAEHIAKLKELALASRLDAPLLTVTGWGNAEFPRNEVIPVFGIYPDAFWESALTKLPPSPGYLFDFRRDAGGIAADPEHPETTAENRVAEYPYFLAEAGGGMQQAYHRRPVVSADDVASILVTHIGAGANLYGYYMFHGGSNPVGKLSTFQESAAIDGVYDLPVISYDFEAPLGEFGQVRESYKSLRRFHLFLNESGSTLAPMAAYPAEAKPVSEADFETPRAAVRSDGNSAFLFFNNYVRDYPASPKRDLQFEIHFPAETITFPEKPVTAPSGSYFIWPVNVALEGALLKYSTAQLLCSLTAENVRYYFFSATKGIDPEFAFDASSVESIKARSGRVTKNAGRILIDRISVGTNAAVQLQSREGKEIRIVVLSPEESGQLSKITLAGKEYVLLAQGNIFSSGDKLFYRTAGESHSRLAVIPALPQFTTSIAQSKAVTRDGVFTRYEFTLTSKPWQSIRFEQKQNAAPSKAVKRGKYNAIAPMDEDFERAAVWILDLSFISPKDADGTAPLWLRLDYIGDVARLYAGNRLLADDFYHGEPWLLNLRRILREARGEPLQLKILPLRKDAPIYLEPFAWPDFAEQTEAVTLRSVQVNKTGEVILAIKP